MGLDVCYLVFIPLLSKSQLCFQGLPIWQEDSVQYLPLLQFPGFCYDLYVTPSSLKGISLTENWKDEMHVDKKKTAAWSVLLRRLSNFASHQKDTRTWSCSACHWWPPSSLKPPAPSHLPQESLSLPAGAAPLSSRRRWLAAKPKWRSTVSVRTAGTEKYSCTATRPISEISSWPVGGGQSALPQYLTWWYLRPQCHSLRLLSPCFRYRFLQAGAVRTGCRPPWSLLSGHGPAEMTSHVTSVTLLTTHVGC